MITDETLLQHREKGWIVGPNEDESSFLTRIELCTKVPCDGTLNVYGMSLNWIKVSYDNSCLKWWEGALIEISDSGYQIFLKKAFQKQENFLGYKKSEVILHEAVHACRMAFDEPRFEELFAYETSKNRFRRYFGPFFQTPKESTLFVFLLAVACLSSIFFFSWINFLVPLFPIGFGLIRLVKKRRHFDCVFKKIESWIGDKEKAFRFLLHFTDKEILELAQLKEPISSKTWDKMCDGSLRWRQIQSSISLK